MDDVERILTVTLSAINLWKVLLSLEMSNSAPQCIHVPIGHKWALMRFMLQPQSSGIMPNARARPAGAIRGEAVVAKIDAFLKLSIVAAVLLASASVAYYYVVYLPDRDARIDAKECSG